MAVNSSGTSTASASDGTSLSFTTGQMRVVASQADFPGTLATASSGDTIVFSPALSGAVFMLGSVIPVANNIAIDGSGLANEITFNGNNSTSLFQVIAGATVVLNSLIITNGSTGGYGGGINNNGTLMLNQCTCGWERRYRWWWRHLQQAIRN